MKTIGTVGMVVIYPMHAAYNILKKGWLQWILPIIFWCIAIWNGFMMYGLYKKEDMILFLFALCWDFAVMRALYVAMEFANRFIFEKLEMFIGGIERGYRICEKWSREKKLTGKERREIENSKIETYIQMRENIDFEDRKQRAWLAETSRQQRAQLAEQARKEKARQAEVRRAQRMRQAEEEWMKNSNHTNWDKIDEALGALYLKKGCASGEIKEKYRFLSKLFHPDTEAGDPKNAKICSDIQQKLNVAYAYLKGNYRN